MKNRGTTEIATVAILLATAAIGMTYGLLIKAGEKISKEGIQSQMDEKRAKALENPTTQPASAPTTQPVIP